MANKFFKSIYFSLRRIYSEIEYNTIGWFRDRTALFFTLLYPILFIVIFGFVFGGTSSYNLYYLNEDLDYLNEPNPLAEELLTNLKESVSNIDLVEVTFNRAEKTPSQWMIEEEVRVLLVIPQGWTENLTNPSPTLTAAVEYYYDPSYTSALTVLEIVDKTVREMNAEIVGASTIMDMEITTTPGSKDLSMIDFYVPGVIGITISTSGMIGLVNFAQAEKNSGILYKKSSTPLKKWEWAAAKEIWQVVFGCD